jgi:gas vesicle protein
MSDINKMSILIGSLLSGVIGYLVLLYSIKRKGSERRSKGKPRRKLIYWKN